MWGHPVLLLYVLYCNAFKVVSHVLRVVRLVDKRRCGAAVLRAATMALHLRCAAKETTSRLGQGVVALPAWRRRRQGVHMTSQSLMQMILTCMIEVSGFAPTPPSPRTRWLLCLALPSFPAGARVGLRRRRAGAQDCGCHLRQRRARGLCLRPDLGRFPVRPQEGRCLGRARSTPSFL